MDAQELRAELAQCYGTERWHRHGLNRSLLYTDGAQTFAENAGGGAYWFLDIVATELFPLQKTEPFLHITMTVKDGKAVILADDGNGNKRYTKRIDYTDCPEGVWEFYLTDSVLMLPGEY